jgi:hypothetical protein
VARIAEKTVCDAGLVEDLTPMGHRLRAKDLVKLLHIRCQFRRIGEA